MTISETYRAKSRELGCVAVVPTYNNAATVCDVIRDVQQYVESVMVVNDGSTDDTASRLSSISGIKVIAYPDNRGKGYALRRALSAATADGFRYAITIDADGQHYADDIPHFIDRIEQQPDSLLIGARNLTAENMPSKNTFANRFSNFWYHLETGNRLTDTQSGFRLYPLNRLSGMHLLTSRYEFEVEIIVRAAWRGVNVENIPIRVYYPEQGLRVSHFRPLRDFTRISILNTVFVLYALLVYYPWRFIRSLTLANIKAFVEHNITRSAESNLRMAAAMGWGVFCGIVPIWGYQMLFAGVSAHLLKLNKVVAITFSNISIPPMIPFILYGSLVAGALVTGGSLSVSLGDVSFETIGLSLFQYIIGSVVLATVCGAAVFVGGWLVMTICKRGVSNE